MTTLIDEYGDTGIIQPETRRDGDGQTVGPRPRDARSYEERQVAPREDRSPVDVHGQTIEGP